MSYNANDENKSSSKGRLSLGTIALIGGGLFLASKIFDDGVSQPLLTEDDIRLLNTDPVKLQTMVNTDTSPVIFHVSGNQLSQEQRLAALAAMNAQFSAQIQTMANKVMVDPDILTNALIACLAISDGAVREQSMNLFMKYFNAWSTLFVDTTLALGSGIAQITAGTAAAINSATTCNQWTFVKKTTQDVNQTSTLTTSVRYKNSGTKVLMGILGSGKTSESFHQTVNEQTMSEHVVTEFVPHCTSQVVDIDQIYAILTAQVIAITPLYHNVQLVCNIAPRIESFVSP